MSANPANTRIAYLGPSGTFTEQALRSESDLAAMELVPFPKFVDVLYATSSGDTDLGFVAIEKAVEGTVNPNRPRQNHRGADPARRQAWLVGGHPSAVRGPKHQPVAPVFAAGETGDSATIVSSSTSRVMSPTS